MADRKGWLPREGFTADVVQNVVAKTVFNPFITVPLYLFATYTRPGQDSFLDHSIILKCLTVCVVLGIARSANNFLNRNVLNNWQTDQWDWTKELVVITGGSGGIGQALVHRFATKNVKTIILDIAQPDYDLPNPKVHYIPLDLCSPTAISTAAETIRATHGPPTILINNAGLALPHTLLTTPDSHLDRIFAINTLSHFRLVREFLPAMTAANHGLVVTVASVAGFLTAPGLVDYCCTKAAAVAFHEGLAAELRGRFAAPRVRTICVCPGVVATKMTAGMKNESRFLTPTVSAETLADAVWRKIERGESGVVVVPRTLEWLALGIRALPYWYQEMARDGINDVFGGRGRRKGGKT